jgi:hypothetical protein
MLGASNSTPLFDADAAFEEIISDPITYFTGDVSPPAAPPEAPQPPKAKTISIRRSKTTTNITRKCAAIYIGGASTPPGCTTSDTDVRSRSNLSCMKCDYTVLRHGNRRWAPEADVLFFRNNFPEVVTQMLRNARGWAAYCCQCGFADTDEEKKDFVFFIINEKFFAVEAISAFGCRSALNAQKSSEALLHVDGVRGRNPKL